VTSSADNRLLSLLNNTPTPLLSAGVTSAAGAPLRGVQCHLDNKELWDKFYALGTEMIITKSGRSDTA